MQLQLKSEFEEILEPLGESAADFFLAAGLYFAHKVSFAAAAALADLSFNEFLYRLRKPPHTVLRMGYQFIPAV